MTLVKSFIRLFSVVMVVAVGAQAQVTPTPFAAFLGSGSPVTWSPWTSASGQGALQNTPPAIGIYCQANPPLGPWTPCVPNGGGGIGTVSNFSAGNFAPLFTTTVATSTTTPVLSFTATPAAQNVVLAGPATGGTGAYSFRALFAADIPSLAYAPVAFSASATNAYTSVGATLDAFGDSHPSGFLLGVPLYTAFPALIAGERGWSAPINNAAVAGDTFVDLPTRMTTMRSRGNSTVAILNESTNDVTAYCTQQGGGCTTLTTLHQNMLTYQEMAFIAILGTKDSQKSYANSSQCILTTNTGGTGTTWAVTSSPIGPGAAFTGRAGDSATCHVSGTRIDFITAAAVAATGTWTLTVDGSLVTVGFTGTTIGSTHIDVGGNNGGTVAFIDTPINGLSSGDHTLVFTAVTVTGNVEFYAAIGSTVASQKPLVAASYASRCATTSTFFANRSDTLIAFVKPIQKAVFDQMQASGFNLVTVDYNTAPTVAGPYGTIATSFWDPNDTAETASDGNHPNTIGHRYVANAYLNAFAGK